MKELNNISILMISQDPGLLGASGSGDVVARHQKYASFLKRLDIIVLSKFGEKQNKIADNCQVYGFESSLSGIWKAHAFAEKLAKEKKYDLIDAQDPHATGWLGAVISKKFKTKLELHLHGDFLENKHWLSESFKNRIYNILQKKILPKADAIRVVNRDFAAGLSKLGVAPEKIEVISTPVNEAAFVGEIEGSESISERFEGKRILLFVGRLAPAKNIMFMLDAIKSLAEKRSDFVILIIGDGQLREEIERKIKLDGLEKIVFMEGVKDHTEQAKYYKAAFLFLLMSTNESFGKVIIEAGFAGLPTLASMAAGPKAVISDDIDGWLVPINDLSSTVQKIDQLLDEPDRVRVVGLTARTEFISRYGQKASFEKIKTFWYKIVNGQL